MLSNDFGTRNRNCRVLLNCIDDPQSYSQILLFVHEMDVTLTSKYYILQLHMNLEAGQSLMVGCPVIERNWRVLDWEWCLNWVYCTRKTKSFHDSCHSPLIWFLHDDDINNKLVNAKTNPAQVKGVRGSLENSVDEKEEWNCVTRDWAVMRPSSLRINEFKVESLIQLYWTFIFGRKKKRARRGRKFKCEEYC